MITAATAVLGEDEVGVQDLVQVNRKVATELIIESSLMQSLA